MKLIKVYALLLLLNYSVVHAQKNRFSFMKEYQLTFDKKGHTLNMAQCFSFDDQWLVYDTRNDDTHIGQTCCIEKINVNSKAVIKVYQAKNQTVYGPGVGAAAYNPTNNKIIFIHGTANANKEKPYSVTRRTGLIVDEDKKQVYHADARNIVAPFTIGALRGGTHAHRWSADGQWVSFTYNDFVIAEEESKNGKLKDLRTVGIMVPNHQVKVPKDESGENNDGAYFSTVIAQVTQNPKPGSDEIEKAFDESWIGKNGYLKKDGSQQKRAIAFQGNVRDESGKLVTEIFVADIPEDIAAAASNQVVSSTQRINPPLGVTQRRVTFTTGNNYPGLQGPRHWLSTSANGSHIYGLMKDDKGVVQIFSVPTIGGAIKQVTHNKYPIQAGFSLNPDDKYVAYVANNQIYITEISTSKTEIVTNKASVSDAPIGAMVWSHKGDAIAYNRYVSDGNERWLQIFILSKSSKI